MIKHPSVTGKITSGSINLSSQEIPQSEETLEKTVFTKDKKESSVTDVNQNCDQNLTKPKTKRNKKIVYIETDEQLSAHKARIIMLEEQNRDYENTITLLQRKLNSNNIASESKVYQQNEQTNTLNNRLCQFEASIKSQLDILKLEMQHKFTIHELNMKHHLEVSELNAKMDRMKQQGTSTVSSVPQQQPNTLETTDYNQPITTALPVYHQPLRTAPPVYHQPIPTAPPVYHQPLRTAPPVLHQPIPTALSVFRQQYTMPRSTLYHPTQSTHIVHPHNMTTTTMNSHHHAKILYSQQNCRQYANQAVIFQNPILSSRQPYNTNQHIQPRQCIPEPIVPKKHVQKDKRQNYNKLIVQQDIAGQSPMTEKCQNVENVAMCSTTEPKNCDTEPNKDNVPTGNHANMTNLGCGRQDLVKEPISSTEDSDQHHFLEHGRASTQKALHGNFQ
ncbi:Hypothetical predicted protein [Mytilus galloprovincialis]|uniref:Uncharacterized protein n=1 Tax=Mytilus galloprovincialis TaxID=29158 RepID=A0A8B6BGJ3_MYTGA|nr:Hypothetical predicted protein [Mytilus galloprovincialis]